MHRVHRGDAPGPLRACVRRHHARSDAEEKPKRSERHFARIFRCLRKNAPPFGTEASSGIGADSDLTLDAIFRDGGGHALRVPSSVKNDERVVPRLSAPSRLPPPRVYMIPTILLCPRKAAKLRILVP